MATINVKNPSDDLKMVAVLHGFDPEACTYRIDTAERIDSVDFMSMLSGTAAPEPEESVADIVARRCSATMADLTIKCGKHKPVRVSLECLPPEVVADIQSAEEQTAADKARFNNLSKDEQASEVEGLLDQLRGQPGFLEIRFNRDDNEGPGDQ